MEQLICSSDAFIYLKVAHAGRVDLRMPCQGPAADKFNSILCLFFIQLCPNRGIQRKEFKEHAVRKPHAFSECVLNVFAVFAGKSEHHAYTDLRNRRINSIAQGLLDLRGCQLFVQPFQSLVVKGLHAVPYQLTAGCFHFVQKPSVNAINPCFAAPYYAELF